MNKIKVLTWNVHGNYLYYLSQTNLELFVPVKPSSEEGYSKLSPGFKWKGNVYEVASGSVKGLEFDLILFQTRKNYLTDQFELLSKIQQGLPKIFLEHEPPRKNPVCESHPVTSPEILVVHVTHFNKLMWDNGKIPTKVIEHGVVIPNVISYKGDIPRGIVVINNLKTRGRRLGWDIFEKVRKHIPLDLAGMGSKELGGIGEVPFNKLINLIPRYRFFFNPIRYTSLGLSVCEAMMTGTPIVGLATTEMTSVIKNGKHGFIDTNIDILIEKMKLLIHDKQRAEKLGLEAKKYAEKRFSIKRFTAQWEEVFDARKGCRNGEKNSYHL